MKKYLYMLLSATLVLGSLSACGDDKAEPSALEENIFLNPYGATAADQQLQQAFFQQTGIYVLFNDTLYKKQTSVNPDGTPYYDTKTINIQWALNGTQNGVDMQNFAFDYLTTDVDKREAVDFVKNSVLPSLGPAMRPYSFLLVNAIRYNAYSYGSLVPSTADVYSGWRCLAINVNGIAELNDTQKNAKRISILKSLVSNKITALDESRFEEFYSFCSSLYSTYAMNDAAEPFLEQYPTTYDVGLLSAYSWGSPYGFPIYNVKAKEYDLEDYTNAIFDMTEEEFNAAYGQYPIVMKKYYILRNIIEELGVII